MNSENEKNVPNDEPPLQAPPDDPGLLERRRIAAESMIRKYVILAMVPGLIPSALVDMVALTILEVRMIGDLARVYDFPVPHRLVRYKVLISLIGSIGSVYLSAKLHTTFKTVPIIGYAVSAGMLSITGGAAIYAVGKIFQRHYESGGTFLSGGNASLKQYFREEFQEGKKVASAYAKPAAS